MSCPTRRYSSPTDDVSVIHQPEVGRPPRIPHIAPVLRRGRRLGLNPRGAHVLPAGQPAGQHCSCTRAPSDQKCPVHHDPPLKPSAPVTHPPDRHPPNPTQSDRAPGPTTREPAKYRPRDTPRRPASPPAHRRRPGMPILEEPALGPGTARHVG